MHAFSLSAHIAGSCSAPPSKPAAALCLSHRIVGAGSLQEDLTKKDPRLPPSGLDKVEKPPGNWPSTSTTGHAGGCQPLPSRFAGHCRSSFLEQFLSLASHPGQGLAATACI